MSNGHQPPSGSYMGKEELNIEVYGGYLNDRNGEDKLPFVCKLRLVLSNIWCVTSLCTYPIVLLLVVISGTLLCTSNRSIRVGTSNTILYSLIALELGS